MYDLDRVQRSELNNNQNKFLLSKKEHRHNSVSLMQKSASNILQNTPLKKKMEIIPPISYFEKHSIEPKCVEINNVQQNPVIEILP